jgi:hypothetical protein
MSSSKKRGKAKANSGTPELERNEVAIGARESPEPSNISLPITPRKKKNLPLAESPIEPLRVDDVARTLNHQVKLNPEQKEQITVLAKPARSANRTFSQLSKSSQDGPEEKESKIDIDPEYTKAILKALADLRDTELTALKDIIVYLKEQWHLGKLNITQDIYRSQIEYIEKNLARILSDIVVLRTSYHSIFGNIMDSAFFVPRTTQADNQAYIDLLIQRYRTPPNAKVTLFQKRDNLAQNRFRHNVLQAYDAIGPDGQSIWCVVTGGWLGRESVKAAHIVRHNTGEVTARHLFGPTQEKDGHIMSPRNGLPMNVYAEEAFDDGRIVIMPDEKVEGEFVLVVLDKAILEMKPLLPYQLNGTMHGRRLSFRNNFRPSKSYLYFTTCMSILRRERHNVDGWGADRQSSLLPAFNWASPGEYLRTSTLQKIAQQVGHLSKEDAVKFAARSPYSDIGGTTMEHVDDTHSHIATAVNLRLSLPDKGNDKNEDDEDEDDEEEDDENEDNEEDPFI